MSMAARRQLFAAAAFLCASATCISHLARSGDLPGLLNLHGGKAIYDAACAACHGTHGEGTPRMYAGFEPPATMPHFNKCDESTPEYARDYKASIRDGGPARGFSTIMPAFGDVLTSAQMDQVIDYLRSLCKEKGWPLGELNVPRALVTEKAFPESETVLTATANVKGAPAISNELAYERILGKRDQLELALPFGWMHKDGGGMTGGLGDIAIGDKHVLYSHLNDRGDAPAYTASGSIVSLQAEAILPTGDYRRGFGGGEPALTVFGAYDQLLPDATFLQVQAGMTIPRHTERGPRSAFLNTAFGKSFSDGGDRRLWTPMLEIIGDRDLTSGTKTDWDVIPEFQLTLNRRQHIRAALGYRLPINDTYGRPKQVIGYVLWDWFDGGLFEGW